MKFKVKNEPQSRSFSGSFQFALSSEGCILRCLPLNICQSTQRENFFLFRHLSALRAVGTGTIHISLHNFAFWETRWTRLPAFPSPALSPHPPWVEERLGLA